MAITYKENPDCPQCGGKHWYRYTTTGTHHMCPCDLCCNHDDGLWLLPEGYQNAGSLCCPNCGKVIEESPAEG